MGATEEISVKGSQIVVCGHRGAGKSTCVQHILDHVPAHMVYDMNREHDAYNRYLPQHRRGDEARAEVDGVISRLVLDNDPARRPGFVVIEEANRVVPNKGKIPPAVGELVDLGRHYERPGGTGIGVAYVTRRPAQLDTDVMELADNLIVYRVRGRNDKNRLNEEAPGLGDAAAALEGYEWILVRDDRSYVKMEPVPEGDTTGTI